MILNRTEITRLLSLKHKAMKTCILLGLLCLAIPCKAQGQNWKFEMGNLNGWSATGTAFNRQPTFGDNVAARIRGTRVGQQGEYWIGTYENRHTPADTAGGVQGDDPRGTLTSAEFTINRHFISFLIGGGLDFIHLRVELLIKIGPGEPEPPRDLILGLLGIGQIVTLPDSTRYFVATHSTGRNTEVMRREVWDVSTFMGRNARIRILDSSRLPWGHINVDDFEFVDEVAASRVHVTNELGANLVGAEVFVNGVRRGVTDASGILSISQLTTGYEIVARKLVKENPSFRLHHAEGSTQDWNYRVYNTSMKVNDDGTTSPFVVTNPLVQQELRLERGGNTLIGVHLLVTTEWDATLGELLSIRDEKLIPASQYLYNVTDGQFFIEQVELVDNAESWFDADVLVFANLSMRENAIGAVRGFLNPCLCTGMRVKRMTGFKVYVHEFGHYGFGLQDEYSYLDDGHARCTAKVTDSSIADFGSNQPRASCMMADRDLANKLCSHRPENPHLGWTLQGGMSCWTQLAMTYADADARARWSIRTPDTRGAIVGTLPDLLSGWSPRVTIRNNTRANLCEPFDMPIVIDVVSRRSIGNFEIWNTTFYGHGFIEGNTSTDDPMTPDDDEGGRLRVTGVHIGDILTGRGGVRFDVTSCTLARASLEPPRDVREAVSELALFRPSSTGLKMATLLNASDHFGALEQEKGARELVARPEPFDLQISFAPTSRAGEGEVRVSTDTKLEAPPQVVLTLVGTMQPQKVSMHFDANNKTYVGLVNKLPAYTQATIRVRASSTKNEVVDRFVSVSLSPVIPKKGTDLGSTDGHLALMIPEGVLPPNSYIAIGPPDGPPPSLEKGLVIASGPFNVLASTRKELSQPIILRFQLPTEPGKGRSASTFDSKSFEIRHYNADTKQWESVGGVYLPVVDIVTLQTKELGAYVLVARPAPAPVKTQKTK
jgi:hypothetical protein